MNNVQVVVRDSMVGTEAEVAGRPELQEEGGLWHKCICSWW